jgi:hypothetical protein
MDEKQERYELPIRLAIRHEGEYLNAYVAPKGTWHDAVHIGSITINVAESPDILDRWRTLMIDILAQMVLNVTGQRPEFKEEPAPPSDFKGKA